jgi:hypothetical protein
MVMKWSAVGHNWFNKKLQQFAHQIVDQSRPEWRCNKGKRFDYQEVVMSK